MNKHTQYGNTSYQSVQDQKNEYFKGILLACAIGVGLAAVLFYHI